MQVRNADIVVSAAGRAGLVKGHWIRPGAVVVDVAMNTQGENATVVLAPLTRGTLMFAHPNITLLSSAKFWWTNEWLKKYTTSLSTRRVTPPSRDGQNSGRENELWIRHLPDVRQK